MLATVSLSEDSVLGCASSRLLRSYSMTVPSPAEGAGVIIEGRVHVGGAGDKHCADVEDQVKTSAAVAAHGNPGKQEDVGAQKSHHRSCGGAASTGSGSTAIT